MTSRKTVTTVLFLKVIIKVNESIDITQLRQWHDITFNNFLVNEGIKISSKIF